VLCYPTSLDSIDWPGTKGFWQDGKRYGRTKKLPLPLHQLLATLEPPVVQCAFQPESTRDYFRDLETNARSERSNGGDHSAAGIGFYPDFLVLIRPYAACSNGPY
jgi:hypothetical protein